MPGQARHDMQGFSSVIRFTPWQVRVVSCEGSLKLPPKFQRKTILILKKSN